MYWTRTRKLVMYIWDMAKSYKGSTFGFWHKQSVINLSDLDLEVFVFICFVLMNHWYLRHCRGNMLWDWTTFFLFHTTPNTTIWFVQITCGILYRLKSNFQNIFNLICKNLIILINPTLIIYDSDHYTHYYTGRKKVF